MQPGHLAILLLLPFVGVFVYAAWQENRRYRQEGSSTYGLTYDPESNTTFVGTIADSADSYDPEEFDPEQTSAPEDRDTGLSDHPETDADTQDKRT